MPAAIAQLITSARALFRLRPETAQKSALTHTHPQGQRFDGMGNGQMLVKIIKQLAQALALPQLSHRSAKLLGLRAVPMGRDHQPTRHAVCRFNTVIPAHHVQAQINPAALPAEVRISPSSRYSTSSTTVIAG